MIELIQLWVIGIASLITLTWIFRCFTNLRVMYRKNVNGILEQLAWEKLLVSILHFILQFVWFISAVNLYFYTPDTYEGFLLKNQMSIRALVGSVIVLLIVSVKIFSWNRIRELDSRLP